MYSKIVLLTLLFFSPPGFAQVESRRLLPASPVASCGTRITPSQVAVVRQLQELGLYELPPGQEEFFFTVPMTFHIVRRSNGTGGIHPSAADATLPVLNNHFLSTGVRFHRAGSIDYIDNDVFYDQITSQFLADLLRNTNSVPDTINVYFVNEFQVGGIVLCGQSSFTTSGAQGILMDYHCTTAFGNDETLTHEVGHYFDLYHTHETAFGAECPDGSNCLITGDLLCDTPADPELSGSNLSGCSYVGNEMRCGLPFDPLVENFMSYSGGCRASFTPLQRSRVMATLVNLRGNLIAGQQSSLVWVDFTHTGTQLGSFSSPFATLAAAAGIVSPGGRIVMKTGLSDESLTLSSSAVLDAFQGPAIIGG